jgi:ribonuclease HI
VTHRAELYVDGAAFGNPGPSGIGIVLVVDGETIVARSEDTGYGTNNEAEYRALLEGMNEALQRGITHLHVRSDSQLMVRQMLGEYKVKAKGLIPFRMEAEALRKRFAEVTFEHIRREFNSIADELAKAGAEAAKARGAQAPGLFE